MGMASVSSRLHSRRIDPGRLPPPYHRVQGCGIPTLVVRRGHSSREFALLQAGVTPYNPGCVFGQARLLPTSEPSLLPSAVWSCSVALGDAFSLSPAET